MNDESELTLDDAQDSDRDERTAPASATSPYASGGGGVTFERSVAARYLANLLVGDAAAEIGNGRHVVAVKFQQAPVHPVDDLVIEAAHDGETAPSLVLELAVRRRVNLVVSDPRTRQMFHQFVGSLTAAPEGDVEQRLGLVVAGWQQQASQLGELCDIARCQLDALGFFDLVRTPGRFSTEIRNRLDQIERLVARAMEDLGGATPETRSVQQRTWELLSRLWVLMPRLEPPDEMDWSAVADSLVHVARGNDASGASLLRDRLVVLASTYAPLAARINLSLLRRDTHDLIDDVARRHARGWQMLNHLHDRALETVRDDIVDGEGNRGLHLRRLDVTTALAETLNNAKSVIVCGDSGVGKSAMVLRTVVSAAAESAEVQALCINLRQVPTLTVEFESELGCPMSELLGELSAPRRLLVIDGADAAPEGRQDALCYLLDAAHRSEVAVIAVTADQIKQIVLDLVRGRFGADVSEFEVPPLADSEIDELVASFPEFAKLNSEERSRDVLRRLVVVDLLARSGLRGVPLTDTDVMNEVWNGLIRRRERTDRGSPDARELAMLGLADLDLRSGDRLSVLSGLDVDALDGLRRDGLLRTSSENRSTVGPVFAHDEVRRYAIARRLLSHSDLTAPLLEAGVPRWCLGAAKLACQARLAESESASYPVNGRFAELQRCFDALADKGHGARWRDIPGEALLALASPGAILADAWPELRHPDGGGLGRLARLVNQRLRRSDGFVGISSIEPIAERLLDEATPWRLGTHAVELLRDWLHSLIIAEVGTGHSLRVRLRELLVAECMAGDRRLAERQEQQAAALANRTPAEVEQQRLRLERIRPLMFPLGSTGPERRQRPTMPPEITDEAVIELLALLGPDLREDGAQALRRVGRDAPDRLAPALEELLTGRALAAHGQGLLAELTEAYYLDDDYGDEVPWDSMHDGIRGHQIRMSSLFDFCAWYRGPFAALLLTDFASGVAVLNRLLNHAARVRVLSLARIRREPWPPVREDILSQHQLQMDITGTPKSYIGDAHVWCWYRGHMAAVGPYPCMSALQALEHACDQFIKAGARVGDIVPLLLKDCENLAMVGAVFGLLVRHLEAADRLLDPFLTQPAIWRYESSRLASESRHRTGESDALVAPERRTWLPRQVAMTLVLGADEERAAELRSVGDKLVENARREFSSTRSTNPDGDEQAARDALAEQLITVRNWASALDRSTYRVESVPGGYQISAEPPPDVAEALKDSAEDLERMEDEARLKLRYYGLFAEQSTSSLSSEDLDADLATAQRLLERPSRLGPSFRWEAAALVAAAALHAQLTRSVDLAGDSLAFAAEIVVGVVDDPASRPPFDSEQSIFGYGADRSAARALPLLLLPAAAPIRSLLSDSIGRPAYEHLVHCGLSLARSLPNEVRMQLARGLDHLWEAPCAADDRCHHVDGWRIATETVRDSVAGAWNPDTGNRELVVLGDPLDRSLANTDSRSLRVSRLDAAIRACAPAAIADVCISERARALLRTLFAAQRRALLSHPRDNTANGDSVTVYEDLDGRSTHTLVTARALLTLDPGEREPLLDEYIVEYTRSPRHLSKLLKAIAAAGEETADRAAAARSLWPHVIRRVLEMHSAGRDLSSDWRYGSSALDALIPTSATETEYLYREVSDEPIAWWRPSDLQDDIDRILATGDTSPMCPGKLVAFLGSLSSEDQARLGLPWIGPLVRSDPRNVLNYSLELRSWLPEIQPAAVAVGMQTEWQAIVDDLVVAGDAHLAPYSA